MTIHALDDGAYMVVAFWCDDCVPHIRMPPIADEALGGWDGAAVMFIKNEIRLHNEKYHS